MGELILGRCDEGKKKEEGKRNGKVQRKDRVGRDGSGRGRDIHLKKKKKERRKKRRGKKRKRKNVELFFHE